MKRLAMTKLRNPEGWISFKEEGNNKYLVEFHQGMDIERVLNGRPWYFDRNLNCIQELDTNTSPDEMNFNYETFWIQVHGLPFTAMTYEGG